MKQKTEFKYFGNISIGRCISPWMADISVSASKKPYRSISNQDPNLTYAVRHFFWYVNTQQLTW